ncbi:hypothetical protein [Streptomyces sp. KAU_LT]|uniref:hypothetical protein n=1 Tax=Streptomyces sp. KAU_LT TaxID=3046669 RepID=UPI0024B68C85|nr:hypothetical protein [Streptomyces sp. KAU_LT]MDI9829668.1 hypothetical protein [Streptomyces sp. KAU_LT]
MSAPYDLEAMVTTTLHLARGDFTELTSAADGAVLVQLTEAGDQRLAEQYARRAALLEEHGDRRAAWLRTLSTQELVALAASTVGGPAQDVLAEGVRRLQEAVVQLRPSLEALRSLGVIEGSR